jgi:hypothetical protein
MIRSLRCEETGWVSQPALARRNLTSALARLPAETWLSLDGFIEQLSRQAPDFLRPDGDFDSWFIRDAETGEYLQGFEAWPAVEGAFARHVMARSLRWLGVVELGTSGAVDGQSGAEAAASSDAPYAFRITALGAALMRGEAVDAPAVDDPVRAVVTDDFRVRLSVENSQYERYQLERFALWEGQDNEAVYRITPESVWHSQNADIKVEQILAFLTRISGDQVPQPVLLNLQAWGGRFGRVSIQRAAVLRAVDEPTMQQLRGHSELRALLGEQLTPTICLVEERHVERLIDRLKALGIWPQISL